MSLFYDKKYQNAEGQNPMWYPKGSPEYVFLHGMERVARGLQPILSYRFEKDPVRVLELLEPYVYFPISGSGKYLGGETPACYICDTCGASGVKLWYRPWTEKIKCAQCVSEATGVDIYQIDKDGRVPSEEKDSLGNTRTSYLDVYIPAVPKEDDHETYWAPLCIPTSGRCWWKTLPTLSLVDEPQC